MSLMSFLLAATYSCYPCAKHSPNDSIPSARANILYYIEPKTPQLSIKKKIVVYAEATGRVWEYKFSIDPDGKAVGLFCNKVSPLTLKDRKRVDTLSDFLITPFFEDYIFDNNLRAYKALCFCFTTNMDSCFERNSSNAIYTYSYPPDSDTTRQFSFTERAGLCASVLGQSALAEAYTPTALHPGEIVFYLPGEPKDSIKHQIKDNADKCARLGYVYLLKSREAAELGYTKISICYVYKGSTRPISNKDVWQSYTYDKNDQLFADL